MRTRTLRGNGSGRSWSIAPHKQRVKAAGASLESRCSSLRPHPVYIVALAWLYVTVLMAATEPSFVGGLLTFLTYGVGPLAIFLYVFGRRRPRSPRPPAAPSTRVGESPDQPDGGHAKPDK